MKLLSVFWIMALLFIVSCQSEEPIKSEKEQAVDYLIKNGFSIQSGSTLNSNNRQVATLSEAKMIVLELQKLNKRSAEVPIQSVSKKNAKVQLIACEDAGTFYINRAIDGVISGVDVQYTRSWEGEIVNIYSYSTGFIAGWSWQQIGTNVINPDAEFCVDGIMTYGIDFGGILLGYQAAVALRVKFRGCVAEATSTFGHC